MCERGARCVWRNAAMCVCVCVLKQPRRRRRHRSSSSAFHKLIMSNINFYVYYRIFYVQRARIFNEISNCFFLRRQRQRAGGSLFSALALAGMCAPKRARVCGLRALCVCAGVQCAVFGGGCGVVGFGTQMHNRWSFVRSFVRWCSNAGLKVSSAISLIFALYNIMPPTHRQRQRSQMRRPLQLAVDRVDASCTWPEPLFASRARVDQLV